MEFFYLSYGLKTGENTEPFFHPEKNKDKTPCLRASVFKKKLCSKNLCSKILRIITIPNTLSS